MTRLITSLLIFLSAFSYGQQCDPTVPVQYVNMTGNPTGSWTSTTVQRNGLCCSASGSDVCIEFVVTLDSAANGIRFDIASGAVPPGALYYQIGCGPTAQVGDTICLNGPGPHHLTFCKPGGNTNTYRIQSIPSPSMDGTRWIAEACSGKMIAKGLEPASIQWTAIPANPVYNSYLSCTAGCDSVSVNPTGNFPSSVVYQVCGQVMGGCGSSPFCDTITLNFVTDLDVDIQPKDPVICFGGPNAVVTANPVGGKAPYSFSWSNGATTQSISVPAGTYVVAMNDSMNCSTAYDTVVVHSVNSAIVSNAGSDQLMCSGAQQTVQLNGQVFTATGGTWTNGSGNFSPDNNTLNAFYTPSQSEVSAGVATLYLITTGNQGCPADTDVVQITIAPQPDPQISGNNSVCQYSSDTYTVNSSSAATYSWSVSGGVFTSGNTGNTVNVNWGAASVATLTVTAVNAAGCDSTISYQVNVRPKPQPTILGSLNSCAPAASSFSVGNFTGVYTWSANGGSVVGSATSSNVNVQWFLPGTGTIYLTATNNYGCDTTISSQVTLHPYPTPVVQGNQTVCMKDNGSYSVPLISNHTYIWQVTGGTIIGSAVNNSVNVYWYAAGSGIVKVTQTSNYGCATSDSMSVLINPLPTPIISGPLTICSNSSGIYSGQNNSSSYQWSINNGSFIGSNLQKNVSVLWMNTAGTGTLTLTETDINGCVNTSDTNVTIIGKPQPVILGSLNSCAPAGSSFSVGNFTGTYSWSVTGGAISGSSTSNTVNAQWFSPGTGTVSLIATNSYGCDTMITSQVALHPYPAPQMQGRQKVCVKDTAHYEVPFVNNHTYNWKVTGGAIIGFAVSNSIDVFWYNSGNGTVSVTQTSDMGCDSSCAMSVAINPLPTPGIAGPLTVCENMTGYMYGGVNNASSYQWSINGGNFNSSNYQQYVNVQWMKAGQGLLTLRETDINGCINLTDTIVTIVARPLPIINGNKNGCLNQFQNIYSTPYMSGFSYQWQATGGIITSGAYSDRATIAWSSIGIHDVYLKTVNANGCDTTTHMTVFVDSLPKPVITSNTGIGCAPLAVGFEGNQITPGTNYHWDFGDGSTSTMANPSHTFNNSGTYFITLIATNGAGCIDSVRSYVQTYPGPTAYFTTNVSPDIYFVNTSPFTLKNLSTGSIAYTWTFGNGDSSNEFEPVYQYTDPGTYNIKLVAVNSFGCIDTFESSIDIKVPEELYIPNAFTPNTDAHNATFSVKSRNVTDFKIAIFNRWGEMVYSSSDSDFQWDGTYKGRKVEQGVYVYQLHAIGYHGKQFDKLGTVTVVR